MKHSRKELIILKTKEKLKKFNKKMLITWEEVI